MIIVVGSNMEDGCVLVVDDGIDAVDVGAEQLLGVLLVEALNCLE